MAEIDPIQESGVLAAELGLRLSPACREGVASPDLIKPARVALVASDKILGTDFEPAGHPDINGVVLIQRAFG